MVSAIARAREGGTLGLLANSSIFECNKLTAYTADKYTAYEVASCRLHSGPLASAYTF
jgi:hypothetical protein